uniref:Putative conserved secreted protein n=1 Tax=Aedes aegypti TaxID=7159 RepID=A0A0P6IVB3_AEDAE
MKFTIASCLALLCFALIVSAQSEDSSAEHENLDQLEGITFIQQFNFIKYLTFLIIPVDYNGLNLARASLPQQRNRCKSMGNCVHDKICDSNCKKFGYKDGECSGRSCICCA